MTSPPLRALLIDDEEELVATMAERLAYRGVMARFATTGLEGLEILRQGEYDVVVLDLKLPGMSGLEVLRTINREHPELPVLLITGHGSVMEADEPMPAGAADWLAKPIDLDALVEKMRTAAGERK